MHPRERLFRILRGEKINQVPYWLLFPYHSTNYYVDVRNHASYKPVFEASKNRAIMLNRRNLRVRRWAPEVIGRIEEIESDGWSISRRTLTWNGNTIKAETRRKEDSFEIEKLISRDEDLEIFTSLPVETDRDRIWSQLDNQLPQYLREKEEFPEEHGAMMLDLGEPIGALYHSADLTQYPLWSLTHPDQIINHLEASMEHFRHIYTWCLEKNLADVFFLVGSELASPPMFNRQTFQKWIVPYARELIEMIHEDDKFAIQHYHGQIRDILPDFLTMAPDALHTIEAPPVGDCTLEQAFDIVGDQIALIGNIQYDEFRSRTPDGMRNEVRNIINRCQGKRIILSPTAGPFDPNPPEILIENYLAFMDACEEYGRLD
jgi:uroporphyrinogen-III decarboxylase